MKSSEVAKSELVATIDFEASSFHVQGAPIEVGLALWRRGELIRAWSSLIWASPTIIWSSESAAIHGISRDELLHAPHATKVAHELNALMEETPVAFCDGGAWDERWMTQLYELAGLSPVFHLMSYHRMPGLGIQSAFNRMRYFLTTTIPPHRAGADAVRLMHAYAYALGETVDVTDI